MLIVFDLDDTLIDTSGSVVPLKLRQFVLWLQKLGHLEGDSQEIFSELMRCHSESSSGKELLRSFLEKRELSHLIYEAQRLYRAPMQGDWRVKTTPNAINFLEYIGGKGFILALVTIGNREFQLQKIKKAGLELSIFSKIMVPEDNNKKPCYRALLNEFSDDPARCVVVGDRVRTDLLPAHELGFRTVHMRWGRGQRPVNEPWIDHSIRELPELMEFLL